MNQIILILTLTARQMCLCLTWEEGFIDAEDPGQPR